MRSTRLICLLLVAAYCSVLFAQDPSTPRRTINLARGETRNLPFSDAVLVGNTLYMSGWIGFVPGTTKVPEDPREEARLLLERYQAVLNEAGMTMENLVSVTVYCSDLSLYGVFNEVYQTYFKKDYPARAFVGSGPLLFGGRFEMQGIAVK
jgi:reactive intermediate/imine deaminase